MLQVIKQLIQTELEKVGIKNAELVIPPNSEMGDLSLPCFDIAKLQGKNPNELAEEIKKQFQISNFKFQIVDEVRVVGPYVNFYLNTAELAKLVLENVDKKFGENKIGKGQKVLIEYPSQNTHKEIHIGHLRNVCIGNCLVQLYRKNGYKMISMNYVNDFGRHVVKTLWYLESQKSKVKSQKNENKQKWLGEIYAEASNYIKDHPEVEEELNQYQEKLENRDPEVWNLFLETRQWSIDGFEKIMDELSVEHDSIVYESEVKDKGQKIVDELLEKNIAEVGERGAIIVNLEKYNLDVALLRKSNGAGVYMTSDLALAVEKFNKYNVGESINITATEQNLYFKQLFKVLELYGFKSKMTHVGYGLVNLPSGKMSSRAGNVILYDDLRDEVFEYMKKEAKARHEDWSEEKINETAHTLTMAILKFTLQKTEAVKNITFDFKEAVSFEGFSAPYILYVVARINSLIKKSKVGKSINSKNIEMLNSIEEKKILMLMAMYGEAVEKALENYNPAVITKYCFDLSQAFNDFYNKHSVLNAENEELVSARLFLCEKAGLVLTDALSLLTIDTVFEM